MSTAGTILSLAYNQLRVSGDSTDLPGLQTADMLSVLNTVNKEWQRAFRRGSGEPLLSRKTRRGIANIASTNLAADVVANASSITVEDSSGLPSSGAFAIYRGGLVEIGEYTANDTGTNVLSGITGLNLEHYEGEQIYPLYPLPENFESFRGEDGCPDGVYVGARTPVYFTSGYPTGFQYSVHDNGTTEYLWLSPGISSAIMLIYNKKTTTIDDVNDEMDIPDDYDWFGVYRLIAHGKRSRGDAVQQKMYPDGSVVDMDDHKADQILLEAQKERNIRKSPKVRPIQTGIRNPRYLNRRYEI